MSQMLLEMQVPTRAGDLRRIVSGVPGRKRVVMEHGPMSGLIHEALDDLADEIVSADPARNALIARSEDSNDERDAQRLGVLDRAGALQKVYVPEEPYRTFRSLVEYDRVLQRSTSATMVRMKALCRRFAVACRGKAIYRRPTRKDFIRQLPNASLRWQMQSLGRRLDAFRTERARGRRMIGRLSRKIPEVAKLKTIPGIANVVAPTLAAWMAAQRPAFGWTQRASRAGARSGPTAVLGSARGSRTGSGWGAPAHRNAATARSSGCCSSRRRRRSKETTLFVCDTRRA